ncbi:acetyltransferase [Streptomyces gardneri]|uniref:GNAT family N-acetyltransferase n=1 Tax=Nocardia sputi TaxID=2943705 RepID=UPI001896076A|nr:GNAT family N-acetyltransferase [Nocardia sputi]MBF6167459.1 acetyltransferase [Streptomyces gardneri]UAK33217.1 acetyltransferase [Nocardia asteroides]
MNPTGTPYVLKRELTDIPDDVRAAPAPVIPDFPEPFALRVADPDSDDPATIAEWMSLPHLARTWEQPWPPERRRADIAAQLAGTYSRPCIVSFDFAAIDLPELGRREVAYVELYRPAKDECARFYHADPRDMAFHIATADQNVIGRGVMSKWIGLLAEGIWAAEPECRRLMGDPDHQNISVRRALAKNGWLELGEFDVRPGRRIALCTLPREPQDVPAIRR